MSLKVFPAKAALVIAHPRSASHPDPLSIRATNAEKKWVHPRDLGAADVLAFFNHLANVENVAAATQNQGLNAISFLYTQVLRVELGDWGELRHPSSSLLLPSEGRRRPEKRGHPLLLPSPLGGERARVRGGFLNT